MRTWRRWTGFLSFIYSNKLSIDVLPPDSTRLHARPPLLPAAPQSILPVLDVCVRNQGSERYLMTPLMHCSLAFMLNSEVASPEGEAMADGLLRIRLAADLADALAFMASKRMVHCDVKPANVVSLLTVLLPSLAACPSCTLFCHRAGAQFQALSRDLPPPRHPAPM